MDELFFSSREMLPIGHTGIGSTDDIIDSRCFFSGPVAEALYNKPNTTKSW